jgi:hypothetical protein
MAERKYQLECCPASFLAKNLKLGVVRLNDPLCNRQESIQRQQQPRYHLEANFRTVSTIFGT